MQYKFCIGVLKNYLKLLTCCIDITLQQWNDSNKCLCNSREDIHLPGKSYHYFATTLILKKINYNNLKKIKHGQQYFLDLCKDDL